MLLDMRMRNTDPHPKPRRKTNHYPLAGRNRDLKQKRPSERTGFDGHRAALRLRPVSPDPDSRIAEQSQTSRHGGVNQDKSRSCAKLANSSTSGHTHERTQSDPHRCDRQGDPGMADGYQPISFENDEKYKMEGYHDPGRLHLNNRPLRPMVPQPIVGVGLTSAMNGQTMRLQTPQRRSKSANAHLAKSTTDPARTAITIARLALGRPSESRMYVVRGVLVQSCA